MDKSPPKIDLRFLLLLSVVSGLYAYWTWNRELAGLGGDNAVYLLTAQNFSFWLPHSSVAKHFADHSQYPPLYPIMLALFGGGKSILAAHLLTSVFLLLALVTMRTWLRINGLTSMTADLAFLLIAFLPGTLKNSMFIMSENLYMLLSLFVLLLVSLSEKKKNGLPLPAAAVIAAAAALTRTAGISLVGAFCLYLLLKRPRNSLLCGFLVLTPFPVYLLLKRTQAVEHVSYLDALISHYGNNTVAKIIEQFQKESLFLWQGWFSNYEAGLAGAFIGLLLFLCLIAFAIRLYQRKLDSLYLLFYFLIILLWPYPAEAKRLIYAVLPIMVGQGVLLLNLIPSFSIGKMKIMPVSLFVLAILVVSLPGTIFIAERFLRPLPPDLEQFRRTKFLYSSNEHLAHSNLHHNSILIGDLKSLNDTLPKDAIIYGIKPAIISFYSRRLSLLPSTAGIFADSGQFSQNRLRPEFFYMMGLTSPSVRKPFYPLDEIKDRVEIIHVARTGTGADSPLITILARLKPASQP